MILPIEKFKEELHKKLHPEPAAEIREDDISDGGEYEDVVFLQGSEADEYLKLIEESGAETAVKVLADRFYHPGEHGKQSGNPAGSSDQTFETADKKFILSWNKPLGYVGLVAKAGVNESCGAGTASVPGSCGADTGVARVKARLKQSGGIERRIGEGEDHEGNEEPKGDDNAPSMKTSPALPTWLDTEAVESAAHFMFRGFDESTIGGFVKEALDNCSGTEEALQRLKEIAKKDKVVAGKSFNDAELDSLAGYRHSLRGKLLGGSKDAILDPDSYMNKPKKANEADMPGIIPSVIGASSKILPTQGQMSVQGANNDIKKANLDIEIAKKNAELAQETDAAKRKKIYNDLAKLEGQKSMIKEAESFPSTFGDKSSKERYYQDFPKAKNATETIGVLPSHEAIVARLSELLKTPIGDFALTPKPYPTGETGVFVKNTPTQHANPNHISHGSGMPKTSNEHIGDIWPAKDANGFIFKNNQNIFFGKKISEAEHSVEFSKSGDSVSHSFEEAIEMLASRLGVAENVFEITPVDADKQAVFLNTASGKKKVADVVASHGGRFITYLNYLDNPELEDMLARTKSGSMPPVDEGVEQMTEKDDIDKKTIVGVLLTAGPEKVSKAFAQAANQGQEQFYQLLDGMDVDGLKILSKGVQGTAATNVEQGVETPTLDNQPAQGNTSGGVEPGDSTNPQSGGSELKDL
jgi:hypothetical protein